MVLSLSTQILRAQQPTPDFETYPVYTGKDLGLTYTKSHSDFRIWAPTASAAELILFEKIPGLAIPQRLSMTKDKQGSWFLRVKGDHYQKAYVFRVQIDGEWKNEVPDPYAKAAGDEYG